MRTDQQVALRIGRGVDLSEGKMTMTAFDPMNVTPEQALERVNEIAKILGVESGDFNAVEDALKLLFEAIHGERKRDEQAALSLTTSERKAIKFAGCSARDFVAAKAAFRGKSG